VPEFDPYAALGIPRTATRDEVARAYRAAVKRAHPDTGALTSPAQMARITEAWRILGDPARRARWDREHARAAVGPHWAAPARPPRVVRPVVPQAPPSRFDSGWVALGVVAAIAVLVGGVMAGVAAVSEPPSRQLAFDGDDLRFRYPDTWTLTPGDGGDVAGHRVIAHLTSFGTSDDERCTSFARACRWQADALPSGSVSVLITAWSGGEPPVAEPVITRPYGLHADAIIGGQPAARERYPTGEDSVRAWWQLSPPGFPDRWIEVAADIRGGELERERRVAEVEELLRTLEFEDS
jgi:curved DNA-binding protein CbpA